MEFNKLNFFDAVAANKTKSFILFFIMFIIYAALVFFLSYAFDSGVGGIILGLIVLCFYGVISYFLGDSIILAISGAKKVTREEYPHLFVTVEGLCAANGLPLPQLYVIAEDAPNAFVVGRDPAHSSLVVTTALLQTLTKDELTAVLAHEVSHIANYDIRFMLISIAFVGAIALLAVFLRRIFIYGGSSRSRRGGGALVIIAIILSILAPLFAQMIRFAISREREYLADANGAKMTRQPQHLASALEKISKSSAIVDSANEATASMYFSNPFPKNIFTLFATHPPVEERVKRLRSMT